MTNWITGIGQDGFPTAFPLDRISTMYSIEPNEVTVEFHVGDRSETLQFPRVVDAPQVVSMMLDLGLRAKDGKVWEI